MATTDHPETIWAFLSELDHLQFAAETDRVRHQLSGPLEVDESPAFEHLRRFIVYRLYRQMNAMVHGGRSRNVPAPIHNHHLYVDRRRELFVRQARVIMRLPSSASIRLFMALVLAIRESSWTAAFMNGMPCSYDYGGLDNLHSRQERYRSDGVLGHTIHFPRGARYGTPNEETPQAGDKIKSAQVRGDQILLAYAARTGFAQLRVEEVIRNAQTNHPSWRPEYQSACLLSKNILNALAFAAEGGVGFDSWARRGRSVQGLGIRTLINYLATRSLPIDSVLGIMEFQGGRGSRQDPFRVVRTRSAVYVALVATALRNLYERSIIAYA